ncbi:MAG: hypothetical protein ACK5Q5_17690 [Planctomycetaceae bacterium]
MVKGMIRVWGEWGERSICVAAGILLLAAGVRGDDPQPSQPGSIEQLSRVVNGELTDVAGALRQLDQSYVYRGMQGCGSATAGSVYIDWNAKGVPQEQRVRVLPPQPLVLSKSMKKPCQKALVQPSSPQSQPTPACPCQSVPSTQPAAAACPPDSSPAIASSAVVDPPLPSGHCATCPPTVVTDAPAACGCASGHCQSTPSAVTGGGGGKLPPNAMFVNGQWSELPVRWGRESYPYVAPGVRVAPSVYSTPGYAPVW